MKNLFVPYNIALLAKEKGFNQQCLGGFDAYKELRFDYIGLVKNSDFKMPPRNYVSAPLYQQIIDWFRKKHNLEVALRLSFPPGYSINIQYVDSSKTATTYPGTLILPEYYQALNRAIEEVFKLI